MKANKVFKFRIDRGRRHDYRATGELILDSLATNFLYYKFNVMDIDTLFKNHRANAIKKKKEEKNEIFSRLSLLFFVPLFDFPFRPATSSVD